MQKHEETQYQELHAAVSDTYFRSVCTSTPDALLRLIALDNAKIAAEALRDGAPGNWTVLYDEWLARATCHSSMAAMRAQEGQD